MYSYSMTNFYSGLQEELYKILPQIKRLRKELHKYPETAWNEIETRKRLLKTLESCEKRLHKPYIETDIVFDLGSDDDSKREFLLLRSELDALRQNETGNKDYKSQNPGAAHNCGHDGHMSMLCGAALLIDAMIKKGYPLPRPVRFIFQPAEEIECGGKELSSLGILKGVKNVLAIHGWPGLSRGEFFSKEGPFFAAAATFSTEIQGKSSHGGLPQNGLSPFPAAAMMIREVEKIAINFEGKAVISLCRINGGSSDNTIPEIIEIRGTIRYYDASNYDEICKTITETEKNITRTTSCKLNTEFISKYNIPVVNDSLFLNNLSQELTEASDHYNEIPLGIKETDAKTVSEDFAFYTDKKPGALVLLGLGTETPSLHASDFDFPEDVLQKGILLFAIAAYGHNE